jgi:hypothetical protein
MLQDLHKLPLVEVLNLSNGKKANIEPVFCNNAVYQVCWDAQSIENQCMYASQQISSFELRENAPERTRIELVFGKGFIHAFSTPADSPGIERFIVHSS